MILDVGSGHYPKGDVNIDLHPEESNQRGSGKNQIKSLNAKNIKNFIIADAQNIPLRSNLFSTVISYHVIEHVDHPLKMLREIVRVAKNRVIMICPHRFSGRESVHKQYFYMHWFNHNLRRLGLKGVKVNIAEYRYIPHKFVPIVRIPRSIRSIGFKRQVDWAEWSLW